MLTLKLPFALPPASAPRHVADSSLPYANGKQASEIFSFVFALKLIYAPVVLKLNLRKYENIVHAAF